MEETKVPDEAAGQEAALKVEQMVDEGMAEFLLRCEKATAQELLEMRGSLSMAGHQALIQAKINMEAISGEVLNQEKIDYITEKVLSYVALARGVQQKIELAKYFSYVRTPECFKQ